MNVRWIIALGAGVLIAGAVGLGVAVFAMGGGGADCDGAALRTAMERAISTADSDGLIEVAVELPEGCGDEDLADELPAVSRDWHPMPGGRMMREAEHQG